MVPRRPGPVPAGAKAVAGELLEQYQNLCLMSGHLGDRPVTFVCMVERDEAVYDIAPLFVVVTDDLLDECTGPDDDPLAALP